MSVRLVCGSIHEAEKLWWKGFAENKEKNECVTMFTLVKKNDDNMITDHGTNYRVAQKVTHKLLSISLPSVDRF